MYPFRYAWLWLLVGWTGIALIVYLSLTSSPVELPFSYGDKLGHLLAYAMVMMWFVQLYRSRAMILFHAVMLGALGIGLEFVQEMSGRYFEYADMLADGLGILLGGLTALTPLRDRLLHLERGCLGTGAM